MRLKNTEKEKILTAWIKNRYGSKTSVGESVGYSHKTAIRVIRKYEDYLNHCQRDASLIQLKVNK